MEIEVSSGGKVSITKVAQQQWTDDELSTAVFAGQIMYIFETEDNSSKYELDYLGFKTKNHYSSI